MIPLMLLVFIFVYPVYANEMSFFEWHDPYEIAEEADDNDSDNNGSGGGGNSSESKKSISEKLKAVQEVTTSVQNALGAVASFAERVKNTLNFSEPFMSWLCVTALGAATVVLYLVSLRWILMVYGVHKFTKRLLRPHAVSSNELMNFLSRVPDDVQLAKCKPLPVFDPQLLKEEEEKAAKRNSGGLAGTPRPGQKIAKRVQSFLNKKEKPDLFCRSAGSSPQRE